MPSIANRALRHLVESLVMLVILVGLGWVHPYLIIVVLLWAICGAGP